MSSSVSIAKNRSGENAVFFPYFTPWENEQKIQEQSVNALVRMKARSPGFTCKKCGRWFQPQSQQWIFHELCERLFQQAGGFL